ncbi:hypothetical protein F4779DRAFT_106183 [Xylariaceae sp. FL0662B]|nr:hypothetical protein F4779DRAFT_106183 [Xylariaceae sp. FL0662B]
MMAWSRILLASLLVSYCGIAIGAQLQDADTTSPNKVAVRQLRGRSLVSTSASAPWYDIVTRCSPNFWWGYGCTVSTIQPTPHAVGGTATVDGVVTQCTYGDGWEVECGSPTMQPTPHVPPQSSQHWDVAIETPSASTRPTGDGEDASQPVISTPNASHTIHPAEGAADSMASVTYMSTKPHLSRTRKSHSQHSHSTTSSHLVRTTRSSGATSSSLPSYSTTFLTSTSHKTKSVTTVLPHLHTTLDPAVRLSPRDGYFDGYGYGDGSDQTSAANGGYGNPPEPTAVPQGGYGNPFPPAINKPSTVVTTESTTVVGTITITVSLDVHVPSTIESIITSAQVFTSTLYPQSSIVNTTQTVPGSQKTPATVVTIVANTLQSSAAPTAPVSAVTTPIVESYMYTVISTSSTVSYSTSTMTAMHSPTIDPPPMVEQSAGDSTAEPNRHLLFLAAIAAITVPAGANLLAGLAFLMGANNAEANRGVAGKAKEDKYSGDNEHDEGDAETSVDDTYGQHGVSTSLRQKDQGVANATVLTC